MLNVASNTRVFVALQPVDLRGSFNRLAALTEQRPPEGLQVGLDVVLKAANGFLEVSVRPGASSAGRGGWVQSPHEFAPI